MAVLGKVIANTWRNLAQAWRRPAAAGSPPIGSRATPVLWRHFFWDVHAVVAKARDRWTGIRIRIEDVRGFDSP